MLLYTTLALSALAIAAIVYRYDLYEREPRWMILLAIALGAVAMHLCGLVQVCCYLYLGPLSTTDPLTVSLMAGFHEELAKFFVVALIATLLRRQFNDPIDGLIYGAMAGLGAAIEESIFFLSREGPTLLPPAELIRLCGHLIMGGIGASGIGLALYPTRATARAPDRATNRVMPPFLCAITRCSERVMSSLPGAITRGSQRVLSSSWPLIPLTLLAAMLLHTAWDLIAVPANDSGRMTPARTAFSVALMLAGLAAFAGLTLVAQHRSRALFDPDDPLSPTRRLRAGRRTRA